MIPYKDLNPSRTAPVVTVALIAANVAAFVWQVLDPHHGLAFAAYPYNLVRPWTWLQTLALVSLITSAFLHGDFWHLFFNMLFLWVFGDNVEDRLGHGSFLGFYLLAAGFAALAHAVVTPNSTIPMVGASGAISAILGAYAFMFPKAKVKAFFLIIIYPVFFALPSAIFIGVWFAFQILGSFASEPGAPGVAWWAHIGGFVYGVWATRFGRDKRKRSASWAA